MSEIAGRLAAHAGAYFLQAPLGGPGVLMGGVTGVAPARILVIGGGVVGAGATRVALGTEGEVTILERSLDRLHELDQYFGSRARILMSDAIILEQELREADVVIGAVLVPGAVAPHLVTREMLSLMKPRSVIVDVAIDQGGCVETSHPTTHADPVFEVDGILHYCVANMPGAVPVTATRALTNATLPYVRRLATVGVDAALAEDPGFARGLNVKNGEISYEPVAKAFARGRARRRLVAAYDPGVTIAEPRPGARSLLTPMTAWIRLRSRSRCSTLGYPNALCLAILRPAATRRLPDHRKVVRNPMSWSRSRGG